MPQRPLPDSRNRRDQQAQDVTKRIALGFVIFLIVVALLLYLLT